MPGTSYWQKGVDFALRGFQKSTDLSPTDIQHNLEHGRITRKQYDSYFNGRLFGHKKLLKQVQEIEDGKLARSQQSDSV